MISIEAVTLVAMSMRRQRCRQGPHIGTYVTLMNFLLIELLRVGLSGDASLLGVLRHVIDTLRQAERESGREGG